MIKEYIGEPAMYAQLAEEAAELAHAAIKYERVLRGENPTPVTLEQAMANLTEEITDVEICLLELGITASPNTMYAKMRRWIEREKAEEEKRKTETLS